MIKYILYSIYKFCSRGDKAKKNGMEDIAYTSFLVILSIIPTIVIGVFLKKKGFILFQNHSIFNKIYYFIIFMSVSFVWSKLLKKKWIEKIKLTKDQMKKNRFYFWGFILILLIWFIVK
ncbi:hypothetical protein AXE80_06345 [Wenyingzhuangia fucanilytica]|uniref:Uncharacterized protein n=1 Tax=Wenyingzhuangia fucanilytica TaxID=1790137 RepID=A0A1B1Y561_9FLAO|nr:hypothetical protein AXE80_06345 [Wenyingzhuangia fucanilytica]